MVSEAMLPRAAVREVEQRLTAAGCPDADFDARELFRLATGRDVRLSDRPLTAEQAAALEVLCTRRAAREPLQYLCGSWSFLDFELAVGPGVLCPRADTEVVAQAAAETLAGIAAPRVLDLCAGTGCLGLGIKRFCPAAQVTCVEKSPAAFAYLEKNARCALTGQGRQAENVLEPSALEQANVPAFDWGPSLNALRADRKPAYAVQPVQGDLFTYWETLPEGQLELIVSNPPYLTAAEMEQLQPEVAQEPAMALEAGEDGLVFYRALAQHYKNALCPGGALVLEIGWQQREAVTALLAENDENTAAEENALVMKLDKPFTFEGQTYTEVDLSGLEDTTAADLQAVGRFVTKKNPAANPATVEMTLEYAQFRAARGAHLPLEFFERLPAKEAIKLKGIVVGFLYGGAGDN